jgi:hypothetical protein
MALKGLNQVAYFRCEDKASEKLALEGKKEALRQCQSRVKLLTEAVVEAQEKLKQG